MAERVRGDVDAAREQPLVLRRGEPPVVPDDVADRIVHHAILSAILPIRAEERLRPERPRAFTPSLGGNSCLLLTHLSPDATTADSAAHPTDRSPHNHDRRD